MTALTLTHKRRPFPFLLLLLLLAGVLLIVLPPAIAQTAHPIQHEEAEDIRRCADDPSRIEQIWINSSLQRFNCLIRLDDGRVGDRVLQFSCRRLIMLEITNYIIGDGSLAEAIRVLKAKGCQQIFPPQR